MDENRLLEAIRQIVKDEIKNEIDPLKRQIEGLNDEVTSIKVTQENVICKNIQLVMEGQEGMNEQFRRLDDLEEKVDDIQSAVSVLKLLAGKK